MVKKIFLGLAFSAILFTCFIGCEPPTEPITYTLKDLIVNAKDDDTIDLGSVKFTVDEKESFTIKQKNLTIKNGNVRNATFIVEGANVTFQNLTDIYTVIVDEKVGDTDFDLKNCYRVEEVYLNGGGSNSVHIGGTEIGKLVANKKNLHIQLDEGGATKIEKTFIFKDCSFDSKSDDNSFESIVVSEAVKNLTLDGAAQIDKIISTAQKDEDGNTNITITVNVNITITAANDVIKESISANEENKNFNEKQETIKDADLTDAEKAEVTKIKEDAGVKDEPEEKPHVHTWDDGKVTTAATCTTAGVKTYTCTDCKETKTEEIPAVATAHTWDDGKVTTAATCTTDGVRTYTCTVCKTTKTEKIPATAHDWDDGVVTIKPTTESEGVKTFTCSKCKETRTESIEKLSGAKFEITFVSGDIELTNEVYIFTAKLGDLKTFTWYFNGEKLSETSGICDLAEKIEALEADYYELIVTAEKDDVTYSATCKVKVN